MTDPYFKGDFFFPGSSIELDYSGGQKQERAYRGFLNRWNEFCLNHTQFTSWKSNWDPEEVTIQFEQLRLLRREIYFTNPQKYERQFHRLISSPNFLQASEIFQSNRYRCSKCISFSYNLATPLYNASIVRVNECSFLAFDSPQKHYLDAFYHLLAFYPVTHLVRLTPAVENKKERCFPYWEASCEALESLRGPIFYFAIDDWKDRSGIESRDLLLLIKSVMNTPCLESPMIAVHCYGGVGRTGTFIAAYGLIEEIDKQLATGAQPNEIKLSIEKTVWQLSLQRPHMVSTSLQYLALHQLVKIYLESL